MYINMKPGGMAAHAIDGAFHTGFGNSVTRDVGIIAGTVADGATPGAALIAALNAACLRVNNLNDLPDKPTSRVNLGLGNSAERNVGVVAGTVAAGNDARLVGALQANQNLGDLANPIAAQNNIGLRPYSNTSNIVATPYNVADDEQLLRCTITPCTINLPVGIADSWIYIKNVSGGNITVVPNGAQTIELAINRTLINREAVILIFDGTSDWGVY